MQRHLTYRDGTNCFGCVVRRDYICFCVDLLSAICIYTSNSWHLIVTHAYTGYNSVQGCPVCIHTYPSHLSQVMNLGSRRQLPADSPLRGRQFGCYHFIDEERRGPAPLRTTQMLRDCLRLLREDNLNHVCGFSGTPMFDRRVGFDYVLDSIPEPMHLFPRLFLFFAVRYASLSDTHTHSYTHITIHTHLHILTHAFTEHYLWWSWWEDARESVARQTHGRQTSRGMSKFGNI